MPEKLGAQSIKSTTNGQMSKNLGASGRQTVGLQSVNQSIKPTPLDWCLRSLVLQGGKPSACRLSTNQSNLPHWTDAWKAMCFREANRRHVDCQLINQNLPPLDWCLRSLVLQGGKPSACRLSTNQSKPTPLDRCLRTLVLEEWLFSERLPECCLVLSWWWLRLSTLPSRRSLSPDKKLYFLFWFLFNTFVGSGLKYPLPQLQQSFFTPLLNVVKFPPCHFFYVKMKK